MGLTKAKLSSESENMTTLADEALKKFTSANNIKGQIAAHSVVFLAKAKEGLIEPAREVLSGVILPIWEKEGNLFQQARIYRVYTQMSVAMSDFQNAMAHAGKTISLFKEAGETRMQCKALCMMANTLRVCNQYGNAHKAVSSAFDIAAKAGSKYGQAEALCMSATIYDSMRDYGRACYKLEKAAKIYAKLDNKKEEAKTLESIANTQLKMYEDLDDYDEPANLCDQAIQLYTDLDLATSSDVAYVKQSLAFALLAADKQEEAVEAAKSSISMFEAINDLKGQATGNNVLAQVYWNQKNKEKAKVHVRLAKKVAEDAGDEDELAWAKQLIFQYDIPEQVEFKMTSSSGKAINASNLYVYFYGKDYALFNEFVVRGTTETQTAKKSSSSSAGRHMVTMDEIGEQWDLSDLWASL